MKAILVILPFFTLPCFSQSSDELSKYCYRVFNFSPASLLVTGTVSFLERDSQYYLLTAKHVLSGCTMNGTQICKDADYPDMILVMGKDKLNNPLSLAIDISKIKDTSNCRHFLLDADIIVVPISSPNMDRFNIIRYEITTTIKHQGQIVAFGYPGDSNLKNGRLNFSARPGKLSWNSHSYRIIDSNTLNNIIMNYNNELPEDPALKGYSGSPVFYKDEKVKGWHLAGVLSGVITDTLNQRFFIVPKIRF